MVAFVGTEETSIVKKSSCPDVLSPLKEVASSGGFSLTRVKLFAAPAVPPV